MNKWINNINSITVSGSPGVCPVCGSKNTHHGLIPFKEQPTKGWGAIWCDDCKSAFHISNALLNEKYPIIDSIPSGLKLY